MKVGAPGSPCANTPCKERFFYITPVVRFIYNIEHIHNNEITITNNLFRHMVQINNFQLYIPG